MSGSSTAPNDRIAAVDVGTNTALLVVAEYRDGRLVAVAHSDRFVRLGEGVDRDRRIGSGALERLSVVLRDFRAIADRFGASRGIVGATSASRDALNRDELIVTAQDACGWPYEILSGDTEARLTFAGAVAGMTDAAMDQPMDTTGYSDRRVLVDVGGGSTEIVTGTMGPPARVFRAASADVGSVRITERFFGRVPPTKAAVDAALDHVSGALAMPASTVGTSASVLGAGGTAVALGALCGGFGRVVGRGEILHWRDRLLGMTADEVVALHPELLRGREDVFAAGVLVFHAAMECVGAHELIASPWGLRHGLALREFGGA